MLTLCYFCWKQHDFEQKCEERFLAMAQRVESLTKPAKKLKQQTLEQAWAKKPKTGVRTLLRFKLMTG